MNLVSLGGFEFEYNDVLKVFADQNFQRLVFISKNYDEIHLVVEIIEGKLIFHPRWNVNISVLENYTKKYLVDVNFSDQRINLEDL